LLGLLFDTARQQDGHVLGSTMRVRDPGADNYMYPDIVVTGAAPAFEDHEQDVLLNPIAVVEVLSPSTERSDRGRKAHAYRSIPSLHTYILIAQDEPRIEWFERTGEFWTLHEACGLDAVARLDRLG